MADNTQTTEKTYLSTLNDFLVGDRGVAKVDSEYCAPCLPPDAKNTTTPEKLTIIGKADSGKTSKIESHKVTENRKSGGTTDLSTKVSEVRGKQSVNKTSTITSDRNTRNIDLTWHVTRIDRNELIHNITENTDYTIKRTETDLFTLLTEALKTTKPIAEGIGGVMEGFGKFIGDLPPIVLAAFKLVITIVEPFAKVLGSYTLPNITDFLSLIADKGVAIAVNSALIIMSVTMTLSTCLYCGYCIINGKEIVSADALFNVAIFVAILVILGLVFLSLISTPKNHRNP
jgi:hypothetical protein